MNITHSRKYPDEEQGNFFSVLSKNVKYFFAKSNPESPSTSEEFHLDALPDELRRLILGRLDLQELHSMQMVSRHWNVLASESTLWTPIARGFGWDETTFSTVHLRMALIYAHHKKAFTPSHPIESVLKLPLPIPKKILHMKVLQAELYLRDIREVKMMLCGIEIAVPDLYIEPHGSTNFLMASVMGWNFGAAKALGGLINFVHQWPAPPPLPPQYVQPDERYLELGQTRCKVVEAAKALRDVIGWRPQQMNRITRLDLRGKNLSSLPEEVFLLPRLQEIHLEDNPHLELSTTMLQALASRNIRIFVSPSILSSSEV